MPSVRFSGNTLDSGGSAAQSGGASLNASNASSRYTMEYARVSMCIRSGDMSTHSLALLKINKHIILCAAYRKLVCMLGVAFRKRGVVFLGAV